MQIMNLTAFYTIGLPTASACCKMSDLEIFVATYWTALRHTATMWWDTVMEATKILCNIRRRILSYRKQLSNMSMFKEINDLQHQKYRLRSLNRTTLFDRHCCVSVNRATPSAWRWQRKAPNRRCRHGRRCRHQLLSSFTHAQRATSKNQWRHS